MAARLDPPSAGMREPADGCMRGQLWNSSLQLTMSSFSSSGSRSGPGASGRPSVFRRNALASRAYTVAPLPQPAAIDYSELRMGFRRTSTVAPGPRASPARSRGLCEYNRSGKGRTAFCMIDVRQIPPIYPKGSHSSPSPSAGHPERQRATRARVFDRKFCGAPDGTHARGNRQGCTVHTRAAHWQHNGERGRA